MTGIAEGRPAAGVTPGGPMTGLPFRPFEQRHRDLARAGLPLTAPAPPPRFPVPVQPGGDSGLDAGTLAARIDALTQFRGVVAPYVPPERLQAVRDLADRARQRLTICPELTVVALAGPTGSGKSSLFNALAGRALSPVGVRRPTTGVAYACVWGSVAEAAPLLDWLQVSPDCRYLRESLLDADDQAGLRGLVLLDLPDFDSIEREHAAEVERLLGLVDLVVWVVDPQKYADRVVHERYLRPFSRHRDVTVVALNQADLLRAEDAGQLLDDLRRLLAADGLDGVTTMATSAVDLPSGVGQLQARLRQAVGGRRAAWQRLAADVDRVVDDLADLVGPPVTPDTADRAAFGELADGLADAAGVPALAEAAETAYRDRADAALGSALMRWLVRRRRPPSRHLDALPAHHPGTHHPLGGSPATRLGGPDVNAVATGLAVRVAVRLAVRTVAARASDGLPEPWPEAVWRASRSRLPELPDALAAALAAGAERGADRTPPWWRLIGALQWLVATAAVIGLSWLAVGWMMRAVALPVTHPAVGPVPVPVLLLAGGVLVWVGAAVAVQPLLQWSARRVRVRARKELRAAVAEVGRERVVAPVGEVLQAYAEARAALHTAAGL